MKSTQELSDAIVDWAVALIPEIEGTYAFAADRKDQALPDLAVEPTRMETILGADPRFPWANIEQIQLKVNSFNLLVMVEPDPPEEASTLLTSIADRVLAALVADPGFGGLALASPYATATMDPPFVQFDDGTRGRLCTIGFAVAQPTEEDE